MSEEKYAVLIVEDSQLISKRMESQLKELDCISETFLAYNYPDAVEQIENKDIDAVIMDINLSVPGKNGLDLLQFVKDNYPDIKTIMLTNQSNEFYRNLCLKIGSDHFMDKSSEFEKIPSLIQDFYNQRMI